MFKIGIQRDGYIKASDLQGILDELTDAIVERFEISDGKTGELREEVQALRRELDTERRLRLGRRTR